MGRKKGKKGGEPTTTTGSTSTTTTTPAVVASHVTAQAPEPTPAPSAQPRGTVTVTPPGFPTSAIRQPVGEQLPGPPLTRGRQPIEQPRRPPPTRGPQPTEQPGGPPLAPGPHQPRGPPPERRPHPIEQPRGPTPTHGPQRIQQPRGLPPTRGPQPTQQPGGPPPARGPHQPRGPPPERRPYPIEQPRSPPPTLGPQPTQQSRGPPPTRGPQQTQQPPSLPTTRGPRPVQPIQGTMLAQQPRGLPPSTGQQAPDGHRQSQERKSSEELTKKTPTSPVSDQGAIPKRGLITTKRDAKTAHPEVAVVPVKAAEAYKPVLRPDGGGKIGKPIQLRANFFPMKFRQDVVVFHYDVDLKPEIKSKSRIREGMNHFVKLQRGNGGIFAGLYAVFDGRKNVYTAKKLPLRNGQEEIEFVMEGERRPLTMKIQLVGEIPLYPLWEFLNGRSRDPPLEAIQALDIVLREMPNSRFIPVSRYFFTDETGDSMGPGLDLWKGYYQSVRPTQWKTVMLQLDTSVRVFHKGQHVLDLVTDYFELKNIQEARNLDARKWAAFRDHIKGLAVETTHQTEVKRTYKIISVSEKPANRQTFPLNQPDGSEVPCVVATYFKQQYNIDLQFPNLPCLQAQPKEKHRYIPMEFCVVKKGQQLKKLTDDMTAQMIRESAVPATVRERQINDVVRQLDLGRDVYMKEFGLGFDPKMVELDGRILPAPAMQYKGNNTIIPRNGSWNMRSAQFYSSARVVKMAAICFDGRTTNDTIMRFIHSLCNAANQLNMQLPNGLCDNIEYGRHADDARRLLTKLRQKHGSELQLVIVIMPSFKSSDIYGTVKKVGDTEIGVATQCVQPLNVFKNNPQTLANICMKINSKLGEVNTVVEPRQSSSVLGRPVMIMGADVTHPSPGDTTKPSIAAVTASYDSKAYKYAARISIQKHREEIISNLSEITRELLLNFFRKTGGKKPEKIIFYRDGVSEGQFRDVLAHELRAVQEACYKLEKSYQPLITFLVVQKRHHTRLFCRNDADKQGRSGNVPAGTTVDKVIVHPVEFDFYLCSHEGIQGTSRPAHYHVLYDDNEFTSDELQKLTYHLCHVYARCTRSVSIPAPAYYAHHCAFRGRHYLDSTRSGELPESDADIARALRKMNDACLTHENINGMFFT